MGTHNTSPTRSSNQKAPEHHRVKPDQSHPLFHAKPGHSYCTKCGAICFQKRWYIAPEEEKALRQDKNASQLLCPGCSMIEQELYEGEVILENSSFAPLMGEIVAVIKHTEGRCWHHNPNAKLAGVTEEDGVLHVMTTTKFLAERIGKELHKIFNGKLEIQRTEQFVRVYWTD